MMDALLWPLNHALWSIGAVLALVASIGFLSFLRGFLLGLSHLFYMDGHDEHISHARDGISGGIALMINMFVLWVLIRAIATFLGQDHADLSKTGTIVICYLILVAFLYFTGHAFAKSSGGH